MKVLILSGLVLVGSSVVGCGSGEKTVSSRVHTSATSAAPVSASATVPAQVVAKRDGDGDVDAPPNVSTDSDDYAIIDYGHAANAADARTVHAVVETYYAAIQARDGAKACSVLYSLLAEEFVENYGEGAGPAATRGSNCVTVMSKLFRHDPGEFSRDVATLKITGVRIDGRRGYALLRFKGMANRHILVHSEFGSWKIDELTDAGPT